jgi:hypothetical protein
MVANPVPIPDEARTQALAVLHTQPAFVRTDVLDEALRAAAPYIDRAARIAVLQELSTWDADYGEGCAECGSHADVWDWVNRKIAELEAEQ